MLMNADGTVKSTVEINDNTTNGPALSNDDHFGTSVAGIGDLNGDGVLDIAVGANEDDGDGTNRGAVHVMLMNADGTVKSTVEINDTTTNGPSLRNSDNFGSSVAEIGDINDDGIPDIVVGADHDDGDGTNRGAVHVALLDKEVLVRSVSSTNPDGSYRVGQEIDITVTFSEPVSVTGTPQIELDVEPTSRNAAYTSGDDTDTLVFRYAVQESDESADLQYVSGNSLSLNGGTITALKSPNMGAVLDLPDPAVRFDYAPPGLFGSLGQNKDIMVIGSNNDPVLTAIPEQSGDELTTITFTATADDDDGDTLEYSPGPVFPTGAMIDSTSGVFTWIPTEQQDGTHTAIVQVSDGNGGTDSQDVTITVFEVNLAPVLDPIADRGVNKDEILTFTATASDLDVISGTPDTFEFSLTGTTPTGANITSSGEFTWTPTTAQIGSHTINVRVTDAGGLFNSQGVTVTVTESNANPMLTNITPKSGKEGEQITFQASATDDEDADDTLEFSLVGPPTGAMMNSTGYFSWTPTERQDGTHSITVQVSDSDGGTDSQAVSVTVSEVNQAPELDPIGVRSVATSATLAFTATATDGDFINNVADSLSFSLGAGSPSGATITSLGAFTWTPTEAQVGLHRITVTVTDGAGATDSEVVAVTVTSDDIENSAPELDSIGGRSVDETDTLTFTATATDGDDDSLEFFLAGDVPRGASITRGGAFTWTPDQSQDGTYDVTVVVSDGRGGTDSEGITITVNDIAPMPVSARASGSAITLKLSEIVISGETGPNGFTVGTSGNPITVESISGNGTNILRLATNAAVPRGSTLSYSSSGDVADEDGLSLEPFSDMAISVSSGSRSKSAQPAAIVISSEGYPLEKVPASLAGTADSGEPVPVDGTFDFPLEINGYGYVLHDPTSTIIPQNVTVGEAISIKVTMHDPLDVSYFAIYLGLQGDDISHLDSDVQVIYDQGDTRVVDPDGNLADASITLHEDPDDPSKKTAVLSIMFAEPIGLTNMVIRTWNTDAQITTVNVVDALDVQANTGTEEDDVVVVDEEDTADADADADDSTPLPVADGTDASPLSAIKAWAGFSPEVATESQMLGALDLENSGDPLPGWAMTHLAKMASMGNITVEEFRTAVQYVLDMSDTNTVDPEPGTQVDPEPGTAAVDPEPGTTT